jgi:hypothetical protein
MRTLEQRGYVVEVGRDTGPGQAVLFGTSTLLLEKLGLDSLDQLPPLSEFVPGPDIVEALEHGLRPDPDVRPPSSFVPPPAPAGEAPTAGPVDATSAPGAPDGAQTSDDDGPAEAEVFVDPLGRLDETTARLDALVEEVRDRLAAAEAAVAEAEADDADDDPGHEDAGGDEAGDAPVSGVPAHVAGDEGAPLEQGADDAVLAE